MATNRKLDYVIVDMLESTSRNVKAHPMNLGAVGGPLGGAGGPPGGYIGWLPQTRVAYDETEAATLATLPSGLNPPSGWSLVDNLNHIRYRLNILESGILIVDDWDSNPTIYNVRELTFSGAVVTDLGNGHALVVVSGGGSALTVKEYDGTPTVNNVDTIIFSGLAVTDLGGGDVLVQATSSGGGASYLNDLIDVDTSLVENGNIIVWDEVEQLWIPAIPYFAQYFTDLDDTPNSYITHSGEFVRVKFNETGLEFVTISGLGGSGGNETYTDQSGGTSDTYGVLGGLVNSSNTLFTVSQGEYISSSLKVYLNGQLQTQGSAEDWVETSPAAGTFTFSTAPTTGDLITASYLVAGDATANADTLDGFHASAFALAGVPSDPGGRLTLTSGVPVTTADVTGATNVYYTPAVHNKIELWDGSEWKTITFAETSLAIGTVTSGLPYDIFGYTSGGVLTLEKLAWTNGTTRATDVTLQDGRRCKSGDKTRRYLGSFYSTSTTQTEDSEAKRFLWNMYNRRLHSLLVVNSTAHNYNTATARPFNNSQANSDIEFFVGLVEDAIPLNLTGQLNRASTDGAPRISISAINSTTTENSIYGIAVTALTGRLRGGSGVSIYPTLGYSFVCIMEFSTAGTAPGTLFEAAALSGNIWA